MYNIVEEKCSGCGRCFSSCPNEAILMVDKKAQIEYDKCNDCGICIESCPNDAIELTPKSLQETERYPNITEEISKEPKIRISSRSGLLAGAFGLLINIGKYLIENNTKYDHSNILTKSQNRQYRSSGYRRCQRARRGRCGGRGRGF